MPEIKSQIRFVLTSPLSYSHKGQLEEGTFVELSAPTGKNSRECAALKQAFFRAATREASPGGGGGAEPEAPTGSEVIMALAASKEIDLGEFLAQGRKLLTSGVALVEGEEKLTGPLVDAMSDEDFQNMVGEYLVGFCLASIYSRTPKSS